MSNKKVSNASITQLAWPRDRWDEAMRAAARRCGLPIETSAQGDEELPPNRGDDEAMAVGLERNASRCGLEAVAITTRYADIEDFLGAARPALVRIAQENGTGLLVVLGRTGRRLRLLAPNQRVARVPIAPVRAAICASLEAPAAERLKRLTAEASIRGKRQQRVTDALLRQLLAGARLEVGWVLRLPPGTPFVKQLRAAGLIKLLAWSIGIHATVLVLLLSSWWLIGHGALSGVFDGGWLAAWALMLPTYVALQSLELWLQSRIAAGFSLLLKQRLMSGALHVPAERLATEGAGQLLGRVIEADVLETQVLGGAFGALAGSLDLMAALIVLGGGAAHVPLSLLLLLFIATTIALGINYFKRRDQWTDGRVALTHGLVERMVGHRTRVAQEQPSRWHTGEDEAVERNLSLAAAMDRRMLWAQALLPKAWLIVGVATVVAALVVGQPGTVATAIAIGGILLALGALQRITQSLAQFAAVAVAWKQVRDLFRAAGYAPEAAPVNVEQVLDVRDDDPWVVLEARGLAFRYHAEAPELLSEVNLTLKRGDRVLLEGPSGSGKSTLGGLILGLLQPQRGVLLVHGLDRETLGLEGWRRLIAAAPQFHENHVFSASFAFNVLMGRRWPASQEDLEEAETLCRELGLGELLERMPAGLQQMIGDSGWQLSHGERSRLYIARALLQGAELIILDESFAALDPANLKRAMACVRRRAPTLLVVAHP